jgi:hypothetical protein
MNKLFVKICCLFIRKKERRKSFRYKHLYKINKNNLKDYSLFSKVKYENIDFMNSFIFDFGGGLVDQISNFIYICEFYREQKQNNYKIYFNINGCNETQGGFKLLNFNIRKYIDFELVKLPNEILKLYNDTGRYNYDSSYRKFFKDDNNNLELNVKDLTPPMISRRNRYISFEKKQFQEIIRDAMTLITPLNEANKEKLAKIKSCNSVCIHVRRGDMLKVSWGKVVSIKYINKAIKQIVKETRWKKMTFFIFTQDFEWIKKVGGGGLILI